MRCSKQNIPRTSRVVPAVESPCQARFGGLTLQIVEPLRISIPVVPEITRCSRSDEISPDGIYCHERFLVLDGSEHGYDDQGDREVEL
jgi:hypothetical protein